MSEINVDDYLRLLKKSEVLGAGEIQKWEDRAGEFSDARQLAKALADSKTLTTWQAKFILSGRYRLRIGNYDLQERSAKESYGDRFLAVHYSLKRKVDLLIFSKEISGNVKLWKAVLAKASEVSKLDHHGLVHVYDIDHEADRYYLVVEHVDGKPLDLNQPLGLDETKIAQQVFECAQALEFAHQNQVIHGSLQATDLIICDDDKMMIQNLSMSPIRLAHDLERPPQPSDDFNVLSQIGLEMLKSGNRTHPQRQALKEVFVQFRQQPKLALRDLQSWLQLNPPVSEKASDPLAIQVGAKPKPTAPVRSQPPAELDEELETPGFVQRQFEENPVQVIVTIGVAIGLMGLAVFLFLYQGWNSGNDGSTAKLDSDQGTQQSQKEDTPKEGLQRKTPQKKENQKQRKSSPEKQPVDDNATSTDATKRDPKPPEATSDPQVQPGSDKRTESSGKTAPAKVDLIGDNPQVKTLTNNSSDEGKPTPKPDEPQEPAVPEIPKAEKETEDNLDDVYFIGPPTEKRLKAIGIKTYGQLAQLEPSQFIAICKHHNVYVPDSRVPELLKSAKEHFESAVSATETSGGFTKAKPKLTGPFAKLARPFELPPVEQLETVTLSPLVLKQLLGVEIISPEGIAKNKIGFASRREDDGKTQQWMVGYLKNAKAKPIDVAKIVRTETDLKFQWLPAAEKIRQAESLRNCFARLYLPDGESAVVSLRPPILIPALRLDKETLRMELPVELKNLPAVGSVRVEIEKLPKGDADIEMVMPHASIENNAVVYFRDVRDNKDPTDSLWFELHADIRTKMKITAGTWIRVKNRPATLVRDYAFLQGLHNQLRALYTAASNALDQNTRDKDLKSKKYNAELDLNKMDKYMKGIDQLLSIPINVRVVADFDGYLLELAVSDPGYDLEAYLKDQKTGTERKRLDTPKPEDAKSTEPSDGSKAQN